VCKLENQHPAPALPPQRTFPFIDASLMSRSRPTSFHLINACNVLPPEHMITSGNSTTSSCISSCDGVVSSSDTSSLLISQPISLNALVKSRNLSVLSNDAVPMYITLGHTEPESSTTLSTIGFKRIPFSLPDATIFGKTTCCSSLLSINFVDSSITSSAITKSVST